MKDLIDEVDIDASGTIDFGEFLALMTRNKKSQFAAAKANWAIIDSDGDGKLTYEELHHSLSQTGMRVMKSELKAPTFNPNPTTTVFDADSRHSVSDRGRLYRGRP